MSDHPHARGENKFNPRFHFPVSGPSPRAWGERHWPPYCRRQRRTIPTRVGRTVSTTWVSTCTADHPHARGENVGTFRPENASLGPSPRAWGEPKRPAPLSFRNRTIPTRVGRTEEASTVLVQKSDHPHARGENGIRLHEIVPCIGPSPRAWGERGHTPRKGRVARTIPTRVGRTETRTTYISDDADHPHARGENLPRERRRLRERGPSPRAWGERTRAQSSMPRERTIPTRVGRTRRRKSLRKTPPDHPHARGENNIHRPVYPTTRGPSPRAWGELGGGC